MSDLSWRKTGQRVVLTKTKSNCHKSCRHRGEPLSTLIKTKASLTHHHLFSFINDRMSQKEKEGKKYKLLLASNVFLSFPKYCFNENDYVIVPDLILEQDVVDKYLAYIITLNKKDIGASLTKCMVVEPVCWHGYVCLAEIIEDSDVAHAAHIISQLRNGI